MPLAPVPGVKNVSEAIIDKARDRAHHRIAGERGEPMLARGEPPDRDRDIGADQQSPGRVGRMQSPADVFERCAVLRERVRLEVDIAKGDRPGFYSREQFVALAVDAGVADRAAGVVPDGERG